MYRKFCFLTLSFLLFAAACIPVGSIEVGVEPTKIVVEPLPTDLPDAEATETVSEPTAEPTDSPMALGTVSGKVCFPSEVIPAMTAFFRGLNDGSLYELAIADNQVSYSVELPVGEYIAFAYVDSPDMEFGGQYSAAVPCGLNLECVDHSPLPFTVSEGQDTVSIDLCDWYEQESVPSNPRNTIALNPTLEGLVFALQDVVYRVEGDGIAYSILALYNASDLNIHPDAQQALFTFDDDLFLADLNAGTWRNLTNTPDRWERSPIWVPGGSDQIFFDSAEMDAERFGGGNLTTMSIEGTGYTIFDDGAVCSMPAFDPQGTRMVYSGCDVFAWMYDLATGTKTEFDPATYGLTGLDRIISPSWSPDGQKLAWWTVRSAGTGSSEIALAIFDFATETYVLKHPYQPVGGGGFNSPVIWSPNGEWVASAVIGDGAKGALYAFEVNGEREINLGSAASPVFSPNSAALIFRQWPQDGGPAWESTVATLVLETEQIASVDLPTGANPIGFIGQ